MYSVEKLLECPANLICLVFNDLTMTGCVKSAQVTVYLPSLICGALQKY